VVVGSEMLGVWLDLDDTIEPWSPDSDHALPRHSGGSPWTGASGSPRNAAGQVRGKHYTEWVDDVKALKRHEAYEEALILLSELMDAVEAESRAQNWVIAPWYYEQAAIVKRKLKDYQGEVEVLQRYLEAVAETPDGPRPELLDRQAKVVALRDRKAQRASGR
jgi:hypothetical protein